MVDLGFHAFQGIEDHAHRSFAPRDRSVVKEKGRPVRPYLVGLRSVYVHSIPRLLQRLHGMSSSHRVFLRRQASQAWRVSQQEILEQKDDTNRFTCRAMKLRCLLAGLESSCWLSSAGSCRRASRFSPSIGVSESRCLGRSDQRPTSSS